jgi:hypothetical protein
MDKDNIWDRWWTLSKLYQTVRKKMANISLTGVG